MSLCCWSCRGCIQTQVPRSQPLAFSHDALLPPGGESGFPGPARLLQSWVAPGSAPARFPQRRDPAPGTQAGFVRAQSALLGAWLGTMWGDGESVPLLCGGCGEGAEGKPKESGSWAAVYVHSGA